MKKIVMLLLVFVGAGLLFVGCGDDKETNWTGGSGLPAGWRATWETNLESTNPHLFWYTWHVGTTITFHTAVYDENNQEVTDYDTSSTTWIITPADAATITSNVGSSVQITPTKEGTFYLKWTFKGVSIEGDGQDFTVVS
ncbi:MAG: hypothetical protein LBQ47_04845 [Endomicrobium sp.]|jgi:hypothetical protein|nr:hypothetical protein [Endomicrobium sp.]